MINELALARPEIIAMKAYRSARSEMMKGDIWLDANESPWNDAQYNRYPEPQPNRLITKLSQLYGMDLQQLLLTRGSDEGIDLLVRLFCRAGQDHIMICPPTYGMYKVAATIQGADVVEVPLLKANNFALDLINILKKWQTNTKLLFLCSPNNPTGNLLDTSDILSLCQTLSGKSIIVIDEAYIEFSQATSLANHINDYPNLVVLRTLSKAHGLAGIRCGATVAHPSIIQLLKKIIAPYPIPKPIIDIASEQLALAKNNQLTIIQKEREKLASFLKGLSFVRTVWPSDANFLLFEVANAKQIIATCLNAGIVLRDRSHDYDLANCIRVTIGTEYENTILMEVLKNA